MYGDKNKLSQVMRNLVSNGLKFTPVGGRVDVRVDVVNNSTTLDEANHSLRIRVVDSGAGISKVLF
jgi:signal transduction histidine kinase